MLKKILVGFILLGSLLQAADKAPIVVFETNVGIIELKLYPEVAPLAVENFTTHVKNGYYDGWIGVSCHVTACLAHGFNIRINWHGYGGKYKFLLDEYFHELWNDALNSEVKS